MAQDQDRGYFLAREADERDCAALAIEDAPRRVHDRLAQLYAERARLAGLSPDVVLRLDQPFLASTPPAPELDMGRGSREQGFTQRGCR